MALACASRLPVDGVPAPPRDAVATRIAITGPTTAPRARPVMRARAGRGTSRAARSAVGTSGVVGHTATLARTVWRRRVAAPRPRRREGLGHWGASKLRR